MDTPSIDDVQLDDQFRAINRELTDEERVGLRASVKTDGVQDGVKVWFDGEKWLLVDGYNRYEMWRGEGGKAPDVKPVPSRLGSRDEVEDWLIDWQLNRRNLNSNERAYLLGKRHNNHKLDPSENLKRGTVETSKNTEKSPKGQNVPSGKTRQKRTNSKNKAEVRAGKFAQAVDAIAHNVSVKAADDVRAGKISQKDTIAIAALPPDEQAKALAAAKLGNPVKSATPKKNIGIDKGQLVRQMKGLMSQVVKCLDARGKDGNHARCNKALNEFIRAWEDWK